MSGTPPPVPPAFWVGIVFALAFTAFVVGLLYWIFS